MGYCLHYVQFFSQLLELTVDVIIYLVFCEILAF